MSSRLYLFDVICTVPYRVYGTYLNSCLPLLSGNALPRGNLTLNQSMYLRNDKHLRVETKFAGEGLRISLNSQLSTWPDATIADGALNSQHST